MASRSMATDRAGQRCPAKLSLRPPGFFPPACPRRFPIAREGTATDLLANRRKSWGEGVVVVAGGSAGRAPLPHLSPPHPEAPNPATELLHV